MKSRLIQNREKSQQNRFKIVNYTRALNDTSAEDASTELTIVDVEKDRNSIDNSSNVAQTSSSAQASSFSDISDEPYVYDIYIAEAPETVLQYSDFIDLNDLRCVLLDEVFCSYYAYM